MLLRGLTLIVFLVLSITVTATELQDDSVKVNRYSNINTQPPIEQHDLLSVIIQLRIPSEIKTVGKAIEFLLLPSGYSMADISAESDSQYYLYTLTLPDVHREFDSVSLRSTLEVLGGESFSLVVNPVKRVIGYQLHKDHKNYISAKEIESAKNDWLKNQDELVSEHKGFLSDTSNVEKSRHYYGPVVRGQTLSSIAYTLNHYQASAEKIMTALYLKNPGSFLDENMNWLIEGTRLVLPRKAFVQSISAKQAQQFVLSHYQQWMTAKRQGVSF
ncbi:MAG: FimV/HubP family polar landmark protein [Cellvibrionaceae bacterium]